MGKFRDWFFWNERPKQGGSVTITTAEPVEIPMVYDVEVEEGSIYIPGPNELAAQDKLAAPAAYQAQLQASMQNNAMNVMTSYQQLQAQQSRSVATDGPANPWAQQPIQIPPSGSGFIPGGVSLLAPGQEYMAIKQGPKSVDENIEFIRSLIHTAIMQGDSKTANHWSNVLQEMERQANQENAYIEKPGVPPKPPRTKKAKSVDQRIKLYEKLVERMDRMESNLGVRTEPETDDLLDALNERLTALEKAFSAQKKEEKKMSLAADCIP